MKRVLGFCLAAGVLLDVALWAQEGVTFTRISEGELATDAGHYFGMAWGDYDGDGFVDLILTHIGTEANRLYRNNADGTFSLVESGAIAEDTPADGWAAWADYDNDGDLDLFLSSFDTPDRMYKNLGDGTFAKIPPGEIVPPDESKWGNSACWGDLNSDGFVDLYVATTGSGDRSNFIYMNNGDGTMLRSIHAETYYTHSHLSVMSDINNDGYVDLLVGQTNKPMVYLNDGSGNLSPASGPPINRGNDIDISSADYDNDGDLDLVVVGPQGNRLYLKSDLGTFTEVLSDAIQSTGSIKSSCAAWGDYDNDGKIDLFITTYENEYDFLFHNEGDGVFSRLTDIPLVLRNGYSWAASWADYDNDGDLDLIVSDGFDQDNLSGSPKPCALYRNDGGNQNNWLLLSLMGNISNGSAFGAKVYATATIGGKEVTQLREINGHNTELRAHFGLGDATTVEEIRIEWPSGAEQTMTGVAVNQILSVTELWWPEPTYDGWVDTGDWLGWLYVEHDPWIWCEDLNHWMYCPSEYITENGAWVYVPK